ncbi:hypothetical protein BTUL_0275g00060 [Botrytis tulipae]|uniref:Uncharacterized protein n=1 Tax=Botrytis tulipae TaxID=87230 RepID=A0A4Z1E5R2_9HELO|nr:hypothetical protein BTUL_0275g00060 [Botrytis tulipae]
MYGEYPNWISTKNQGDKITRSSEMSQMKKQNLEAFIEAPSSQLRKTCLPSQPRQALTKAEFNQIGVNISNRQKRVCEGIRYGANVTGEKKAENKLQGMKRKRCNVYGASSSTDNRFSTISILQQAACTDTISAVPRWLRITPKYTQASATSCSSNFSVSNTYHSSFKDSTHDEEIVSFGFETIDDSGNKIQFRRYYLVPRNYYKNNDAAQTSTAWETNAINFQSAFSPLAQQEEIPSQSTSLVTRRTSSEYLQDRMDVEY